MGSLIDAPSLLISPTAGARFGAVLSLSDISGDGTPELIIGAPDDDQGGLFAGATYVFSEAMNGSALAVGQHIPDAVLIGDEVGGQLGSSIAPAADGVWIGTPGSSNGSGGLQFLLWQ